MKKPVGPENVRTNGCPTWMVNLIAWSIALSTMAVILLLGLA